MTNTYILTCEHAGNTIPAEYAHLFKGNEEALYSHKAIDFGALRLAKHLAAETNLPLYYTTTSRLLVEANRSPGSEELFSKYTKELPEDKKLELLHTYYFPHRKQVENQIMKEVEAGHRVYHLAVHTFTPAMEGEVREAEIGILYDPERPLEAAFAQKLKSELLKQNLERRVLYNYPYTGTADGLPTYLRRKFDEEQYTGFELEVNQKFFLDGEPDTWQKAVEEIAAAWKAVTGVNKPLSA
jgi:predicted N-formylglutamate amidohydrolase